MTNTKYNKQGDKGIMVYLPIDQRKESCRQINKGIGSQWFNIILQHLLKYKEITPITPNWLFSKHLLWKPYLLRKDPVIGNYRNDENL